MNLDSNNPKDFQITNPLKKFLIQQICTKLGTKQEGKSTSHSTGYRNIFNRATIIQKGVSLFHLPN